VRRIPTLKSPAEFREYATSLGLNIPCDDAIATAETSPLAQPISHIQINGKRIGNRIAIQPMEGWDGTSTGGATDETRRRWRRFGESGAKLIYGGEAMAVRADGRANPNQLIIAPENKKDIAELREILIAAHKGSAADLVIGFQLTHSGRFCKPNDKFRMEPRVAYRHPILDHRFNVTSDAQVFTDSEIEQLIHKYIEAAHLAADIGADFVDIKHCHGYLLHEFLSAFSRPGKYGGSFKNRTRILREIVSGIGKRIDIAVRLSAFDFVPFKQPGVPEEYSTPYRAGFGTNPNNPLEYDRAEPIQFIRLCGELGVKIVNLSAGSPYYNPHIQRPAAYPPSDGYPPPEDPLIGVARQIEVVRQLKAAAPPTIVIVGSAYSYLQEYLPHVAQAVVRQRWTDMVGIGRMVLSYPNLFADAFQSGAISNKFICRTFSDCTTGPRNGMISGCYPLDKHYSARPEFQKIKNIKKRAGQ